VDPVSIKIEKVGNRILLRSNLPTPGMKDSIPGAYFRKDKLWSLPLELETCKLLRERFGGRLEVGPILWDWAKVEKRKREMMRDTAEQIDAELSLLPKAAPVLAEAMSSRTYQRVAARFIADTRGRDGRRRALIADTVGLGKTAEALAGILEAGVPGPYLIICPKTAVNSTWRAEINRWLPEDSVITIPEGKAAREKVLDGLVNLARMNAEDQASGRNSLMPLDRTWVVIHPATIRTQTWWICAECDSFTKYTTRPTSELDCGHAKDRSTRVENEHTFPQLFGINWGAMVVDESHQILIKLTGTPNLQRRGAELLGDLVRPGGVRLAMSGTPWRSKPHQIWSTLNWLDPVRYSGKWRFIGKYWETSGGAFGGTTIGKFNEDREQMMMGELSDIMLRRERSQVRSDLPARNYAGTPLNGDGPIGVWLDMEKAQAKQYKQMEQTATATLAGGEVSAVGVLAELTRLKQFAAADWAIGANGSLQPLPSGSKYQWLIEFMEELGFPDRPASKLVVVSQFTQILNAFWKGIEKDLKMNANHRMGIITGEQSQSRREDAIRRFEDLDDPCDVMFLNTIAGGAAITLDAADVMVILDETWVDDDQEQVEGRIDNRNPERKIVPRTYYYLRSLGTVEEQIAISNAEAKRAGKRIMDGVKPQTFAANILKGSR
jgi:Zierdtviridae DNA helicase